jgi:parallel beta-helix repeat protein
MKRLAIVAAVLAATVGASLISTSERADAAATILVGDPFLIPDGAFPYTCGAPANPCDTIQHGHDTASPGDTILIAAGPYTENVTVTKRLTFEGAGSGPVGTVVTSAAPGLPVFSIDGDAATGIGPLDRLEFREMRVKDSTTDGFRITGSVATSNITLNDVTVIDNDGSAINFEHTGTVMDVDVVNSTLSDNGNAGFRITSSVGSFTDLLIDGGTMANNASQGFISGPSGSPNVDDVTIDGTTFTGNGTADCCGEDDIVFFLFNGDATIKDVTITGDAHAGVQFRGSNTLAPAGNIDIDNVTVNGSPKYGLQIMNYTDVSGIDFSNGVEISTTGDFGLYLENLGSVLDIDDTTLGPNVLASIANVSASDVDATAATFTGAANNFVIEDRVAHGVDAPGGGVVYWVTDNVFVSLFSFAPPLTFTPSIQRGIDAVVAGGVVNVQAGTWNEPLSITKTIELRGAQYGIDPRPSCAPGSQTIQRRSIDVGANNVVIEGMTVAEVGSDGVAPGPVGPPNPDVLGTGIYLRPTHSGYEVRNNVIRDNIFGLYYNASGAIASMVEQNCFIRNNEPGAAAGNGIYSDQGLSNASANDNSFTDHVNSAMVLTAVAPGNTGLTMDGNTSTNDGGIIVFSATNVAVTNNSFTNPIASSVVLGGEVSDATVSGNTVNSPFSGVRVGAFFGFGDNGDIDIFNNSLTGTGVSTAYGVRVTGGVSGALTIRDNPTITGHFRGIDVEDVDGVEIERNAITDFDGPCAGPDDCSAAIRVTDGTGALVSDNDISGANIGSCVGGFWGIYLRDVSGTVELNDVGGIGNGITTGCQEGRAIEVKGAGTVIIDQNLVEEYQKSGIIVRDTVNSTISGNTTTGEGLSTIIAMNGITVTSTGTTMISGNSTSGHIYTPPMVASEAASCGILTLSTATITGNTSTGDEVGICAIGGSGSSVTLNDVISHTQQGIMVDGATNIGVSGNLVDGNGNAASADAGDGVDPDTDRRYYGIYWIDSTGTISGNDIHDITHGPLGGALSGLQSGVGIRAIARSGGTTDVDITSNTIDTYQKGGIVSHNFYGGTTVNVDITGNTITGAGPVNYIAQNGVQVSDGASGTIADNAISEHDYSPATFAATGILLFDAGPITVDDNDIVNNMEGVFVIGGTGAQVTDNTFTGNTDSAIVVLDASDGTYSGNQVFGVAGSYGMYLFGAAQDNDVTLNAFREHDYGIALDFFDPLDPTGNDFNNNCIIDNAIAGMAVDGPIVGGPIQAENNWWGRVNGPTPPGTGDVITPAADIDAIPFLVAPVAGCPVPADGDGDGIDDPEDNCPTVFNPDQANTNGEPMLLPKPVPVYDDATNPAGDELGDACDPDIDGDGVLNGDETAAGLSPFVWDTDGDRTNDGTELLCGSDPLVATSNLTGVDSDNDRLPDACEVIYGTNPNNPDTDGDGVLDGVEVRYWMSNPLSVNSDGDDCRDDREIASVNGDRVVNVIDLSQVAAYFGSLAPEFRPFDQNGDGVISVIDLQFIGARIGFCIP